LCTHGLAFVFLIFFKRIMDSLSGLTLFVLGVKKKRKKKAQVARAQFGEQ
jgi:hypothetical protein